MGTCQLVIMLYFYDHRHFHGTYLGNVLVSNLKGNVGVNRRTYCKLMRHDREPQQQSV